MRNFILFFLFLFSFTAYSQSRYSVIDNYKSAQDSIIVVTEPGFNFTIEISYADDGIAAYTLPDPVDSLIVEYAYPSYWNPDIFSTDKEFNPFAPWRPCVLWDIYNNRLNKDGYIAITLSSRPVVTMNSLHAGFTPSAIVAVWLPMQMVIRIRAINRKGADEASSYRFYRITYWK